MQAEHNSVRLGDLTRKAAHDVLTNGVIVAPIASTEQHGPHLPVCTDALLVEHIAIAAARSVQSEFPIAVAPVLPFGSSDHHLPFGGTISMSSSTFLTVLGEIGDSLAASGAGRILYLNGHGGNHHLMEVAARDLALRRDVRAGSASWWDVADESLRAAGAHRIGRCPGHAGYFETSLMMALVPDLVRLGDVDTSSHVSAVGVQRPDGLSVNVHGGWEVVDGYTDDPHTADAKAGSVYLDVAIDAVADTYRAFFTDSGLI